LLIYVILTAAIILNALANILMKVGMNKVGGLGLRSVAGWLVSMLTNPFVFSGLFCFGLALVAYNYVLSHLNLSVAYPIMTSVGYCIVIVASWLFLHEKIVPLQVLGFTFIITGVWMVAR
jgi:multidrug transporter EmrE-like cation transporter